MNEPPVSKVLPIRVIGNDLSPSVCKYDIHPPHTQNGNNSIGMHNTDCVIMAQFFTGSDERASQQNYSTREAFPYLLFRGGSPLGTLWRIVS